MYPSIQIGHVLFPTVSVSLWLALIALLVGTALRAKQYGIGRGVLAGMFLAGATGFAASGLLFPESLQRHASYTGLLAGVMAAAAALGACAVSRRVRFLRLADCLAPPLALCIVIVRVGSFMAGCDFGKPTGNGWGVTFTSGLALSWYGTPLGTPLHPTQLYEGALAAAILVLLMILQRRSPADGILFSVFVALYALGRFFIEFLRGDADRGFLGPLSVAQWLCLIALAAVVASRVHRLQANKHCGAHSEVPSHR